MRMHGLKTRPASRNLHAPACLELRIKNPNRCGYSYARITTGVYHDLKPRMNVQSCDLGETRKGKVSPSLTLRESVNPVADSANQYSNDNDRDDGSLLSLLVHLLKHYFLACLGLSQSVVDRCYTRLNLCPLNSKSAIP